MEFVRDGHSDRTACTIALNLWMLYTATAGHLAIEDIRDLACTIDHYGSEREADGIKGVEQDKGE
jgi:hypothetical protein